MSSAIGSQFFTPLTDPSEPVALQKAAGGEISPPAVAVAWADKVASGSGSVSPVAEPPAQPEPTPNPTSATDFFPELHFPFWGPIWFPDPNKMLPPLGPERLHSLPEFEFYENPFFKDYKIFDDHEILSRPLAPDPAEPRPVSSRHFIESPEALALMGLPPHSVLEGWG